MSVWLSSEHSFLAVTAVNADNVSSICGMVSFSFSTCQKRSVVRHVDISRVRIVQKGKKNLLPKKYICKCYTRIKDVFKTFTLMFSKEHSKTILPIKAVKWDHSSDTDCKRKKITAVHAGYTAPTMLKLKVVQYSGKSSNTDQIYCKTQVFMSMSNCNLTL